METDVILCSVTMKDLANYFRSHDGGSHNRRFAEKLAREVTKNPEQSKKLLPTGWHEILHPPKQAFIRKLGFDLFADSRGGGTQYLPATGKERQDALDQIKNGPDALSPNIRIEAV